MPVSFPGVMIFHHKDTKDTKGHKDVFPSPVIPAQAGIYTIWFYIAWIPACAGMTGWGEKTLCPFVSFVSLW